MTDLVALRNRVNRNDILSEITLTNDEAIHIIACRESDEGSAEWDLHGAFRDSAESTGLLESYETAIEQIRELVYTQSFIRWESPDISAYISDDFELIATALALKHKDSWVNALARHYMDGRIPHCNLTPESGDLADILGL